MVQLAMMEPMYQVQLYTGWHTSVVGRVVGRMRLTPGNGTTPFRMCHLGNVSRSGNATKADAKPEQKAAAEELVDRCTWCLNAGADDDKKRSRPHSPSAAEVVVDRTGEEDGTNRADVVHCVHETSHMAFDTAAFAASVSRIR